MTPELREALESLYDAVHARVRELHCYFYDDHSPKVIELDHLMSDILYVLDGGRR